LKYNNILDSQQDGIEEWPVINYNEFCMEDQIIFYGFSSRYTKSGNVVTGHIPQWTSVKEVRYNFKTLYLTS